LYDGSQAPALFVDDDAEPSDPANAKRELLIVQLIDGQFKASHGAQREHRVDRISWRKFTLSYGDERAIFRTHEWAVGYFEVYFRSTRVCSVLK
jgi:hypothetical protein